MGREIKRVPVDFDWPLERRWSGYLHGDIPCACASNPERQAAPNCTSCYGEGAVRPRTEPPKGDGWQVWETVSEGSPVTPVFATADELIEYLCTKGDAWCQKGRGAPPSREAAIAFVTGGYAPSFVMTGDGRLLRGIESCEPDK
jgi:hypothetical protein